MEYTLELTEEGWQKKHGHGHSGGHGGGHGHGGGYHSNYDQSYHHRGSGDYHG